MRAAAADLRLLAIFLVAASLLAAELALMHLYSLILWSHLAALVISMALLGFGAAGTVLAIVTARGAPFHPDRWFLAAGLAGAVTMVAGPLLSSHFRSDPLFLVWNPGVLLGLMRQYLLNALPFFCGSLCLSLGFMAMPARIPSVYAANLLGSAVGALGVLPLLNRHDPLQVLMFQAFLMVAAVCIWVGASGRIRQAFLIFLVGLPVLLSLWLVHPSLPLSPYKGLSGALLLPKARIEDQQQGAMGRLDVVSSPALRLVPGLSLAYTDPLPSQEALYFDGDASSAISFFKKRLDLRFTDYLTSALPYHLKHPEKVLVVGIGGGMDILAALYHSVPRLEAVEVDPRVPDLLHRRYARHPPDPLIRAGARMHFGEARAFLEITRTTYDLIQMALTEGFAATGTGTQALQESYLYTIEGLTTALHRLNPGGYLVITRWQALPERDSLKTIATLVAALEALPVAEPARHLAVIRGWATVTILVKRNPLTGQEVEKVRDFCRHRLFDTVYFPGIAGWQTNRYNKLAQPFDWQAIRRILSPERREFLRDYAFNIRPATDDRPYFHHFLKASSMPHLWRTSGRQGLPLVLEWGSLLQVVGLLQAVLVSALLLVIPWLFVRRQQATGQADHQERLGNARMVLYFLCLGGGFMFLELAFLQKFVLFLDTPLYAAAIVIAAFLGGAGLGSWIADRIAAGTEPDLGNQWPSGRLLTHVFGGIVFCTLIMGLMILPVFHILLTFPLAFRSAMAVFGILPLAFCMGFPFPLGLRNMARLSPPLVPWAWAINGCASVIGALLTPLLALVVGFRGIILVAIACYLVAWASFPSGGAWSVSRPKLAPALPLPDQPPSGPAP